MPWKEIGLILFGAALSQVGVFLDNWSQRQHEKREYEKSAKMLLKGLAEEISEGITRSKGYVENIGKRQISFSRIYTGLFDSVKSELPNITESSEILVLVHKIYYRFDLINFNMESGRLGSGQAFARDYISEIETNYSKLLSLIDSQYK